MRARQVILGVVCLSLGSLAGCAAALINTGTYTLKFGKEGESADLTVMTDMVVLEFEDPNGTAYVEYTVTERGDCRAQY
ncbi:MAG: hypothetical protein ACE37F_35530 [Nannocystaceae bacterium]|nr:hypothetical protein [bacterium]